MTQALWDKASEVFRVLIQYFSYKNTHINFHALYYISKIGIWVVPKGCCLFSMEANVEKKQSVTTRDYSMSCKQTKEMRSVFNITGMLPKCRSRTDALTVFPDVLKVSRNWLPLRVFIWKSVPVCFFTSYKQRKRRVCSASLEQKKITQ